MSASAGQTSQPPPISSARSNFTIHSTLYDSEPDEVPEVEDAVHFCLLAEFDIDAGATLAHQYPYPTGTDEQYVETVDRADELSRLAELMLPDGAHLRPEDWTVFYLGQTPSSAVAPLLAHESVLGLSAEAEKRVSRMMSSAEPKRGVAGGGLLYVLNCVRMKEDKKMRRGAMVKAMAICSPNPYIGIYKPLLLLALEEYFISPSPEILARLYDSANAISTTGMPKLSRAEKILLRCSERKDLFEEKFGVKEPASGTREFFDDRASLAESGEDQRSRTSSNLARMMPRKGSASSSQLHVPTTPSREGRLTPDGLMVGEVLGRRKGLPRDTHFFETEARFKKITVPIRIPMTVFDEDVGDTFSHTVVPFPPPFHPHLHTNGSMTHPIILILNAMLAHKRVMFLGHGLPANQVARMVLAACALGSGCGQVLRGTTESAFPYANLASLDILEEFSGFVAGVTNPRFEELPTTWDVLCNLETGRVTVSKDVKSVSVGNMKGGQSSDVSLGSIVKVEPDETAGTPQSKMNLASKADCVDNQFMDEVLNAIGSHYGEANIRVRFTDYLNRFVSLASFQEYQHQGSTKIGYPTTSFRNNTLGSGTVFADDVARQREMWANGHRIDAWRKTRSYKLYQEDWNADMHGRAIKDFDVRHQIARLRKAKKMPDSEAEAMFVALADGVQTYDQVIELLTLMPPHWGGLMPIGTGLLHRWPGIRECAMELLATIQQYPAVASLNYFHRKTFLRLLEEREVVLAQRREEMAREDYDHSPNRGNGYALEFASPETVHGGTMTPQQRVG